MSEHQHDMMTPVHKRWKDFRKELERHLELSECQHSHAQSLSVLAYLGLEPCCQYMSIGYFIANGGFCDCEVLMNVGAERRPRPKRIRQRKPAKKAVKR